MNKQIPDILKFKECEIQLSPLLSAIWEQEILIREDIENKTYQENLILYLHHGLRRAKLKPHTGFYYGSAIRRKVPGILGFYISKLEKVTQGRKIRFLETTYELIYESCIKESENNQDCWEKINKVFEKLNDWKKIFFIIEFTYTCLSSLYKSDKTKSIEFYQIIKNIKIPEIHPTIYRFIFNHHTNETIKNDAECCMRQETSEYSEIIKMSVPRGIQCKSSLEFFKTLIVNSDNNLSDYIHHETIDIVCSNKFTKESIDEILKLKKALQEKIQISNIDSRFLLELYSQTILCLSSFMNDDPSVDIETSCFSSAIENICVEKDIEMEFWIDFLSDLNTESIQTIVAGQVTINSLDIAIVWKLFDLIRNFRSSKFSSKKENKYFTEFCSFLHSLLLSRSSSSFLYKAGMIAIKYLLELTERFGKCNMKKIMKLLFILARSPLTESTYIRDLMCNSHLCNIDTSDI